ncbi:fork head transcription factor, partial [Neoconidiobolus thromboides FSU 785]
DKSDKKPPYSYPQLITRAILESPKQQLLLSEIYEWMMNRFTFFKLDRTGVWRNSVRHNLSVNKAFIRAPRQHDQPGKGSYWTLDQRHLNKLDKRKIKRKFNLIP